MSTHNCTCTSVQQCVFVSDNS